MRKAVLLLSFLFVCPAVRAAEDTTSLLIDATSKLVRDVRYLKGEVSSLRAESKLLKAEVESLREQLSSLKLSVSSLEGKVADIDKKIALLLEVRKKIKTNRKIIVGTFKIKERAERYKTAFIEKTGFPAGVKQDSCRYGVCFVVYTYGDRKELKELRKLGYKDAFFAKGTAKESEQKKEQMREQKNERKMEQQPNTITPNSSLPNAQPNATNRTTVQKENDKTEKKHTLDRQEQGGEK